MKSSLGAVGVATPGVATPGVPGVPALGAPAPGVAAALSGEGALCWSEDAAGGGAANATAHQAALNNQYRATFNRISTYAAGPGFAALSAKS
jgi:hypothetical protein